MRSLGGAVSRVSRVFKVRRKTAEAQAGAKAEREQENAKLQAEKVRRKLEKRREKMMEEQEHCARLESELEKLSEKACGKRPAEDDHAGPSPKKFKYLENPFRAEKSTYDRRLLSINNPFLDIVTAMDLKDMPPDNVVDGQLMDEAALREAINILLSSVAVTRRQYKHPGTELGGRIVHASILQNIKMLTRPSFGDVQLVAGGKELLRSDEVEFIDQESDEIRHEGDEGKESQLDPDELFVLDRYDLKGKVHDMRLDPSNNLVTVIIIECDWKGSSKKLDQGSAYGIRAALCNMRKGRYEPIYIHNWSKAEWRYGILRCTGIVTVKDGRVIRVQCQEDHGETLMQELDTKLKECTSKLQEEYFSPGCYPNGDYFLGTLHLCEQELSLPVKLDGYVDESAVRFFNSLIRTFIGDRALHYTAKDIEVNKARREAEIRDDLELYTETFSSSYRRLGAKSRCLGAKSRCLGAKWSATTSTENSENKE